MIVGLAIGLSKNTLKTEKSLQSLSDRLELDVQNTTVETISGTVLTSSAGVTIHVTQPITVNSREEKEVKESVKLA